jgi:hypothetical protein
MKFLTWILILCFASQAMASTVREGLEAAVNEFEYDMVVEWDQKDAAKAEAFSKKLTEKLRVLYQEGLSNAELVKYIESRVVDKNQLASLKASAAFSAEAGSSPENIAKALQENLEKFGNKGASWNGGVAYAAVITGLLAVTALIIYQLVWNSKHRCAQGQMEERCGEETVCEDYDTDSQGNSYCEDYDTVYSCRNVEVCLRWEKYR